MNFLTTGWQELGRRIHRVADRLRLKHEQRKLTSAEIYLGELGWQQADFPPEVESQIQAITSVELQQTEFSNRSAEIQSDIDELQSRREQEKGEHESVIAAIELELQPLLEAREVARQPLGGLQEGIQRFEKAIAAIRETERTLASQLEELEIIEPASMEIRQELIRLKDKRTDCHFEIEDMQTAEMKLQHEIRIQTREVTALDVQIQEINRRISDKWDAFNAADNQLLAEIDALNRGKMETRSMVDNLDKQKSSAFLAVGRCLADFNIAPMNQPGALEQVLSWREIVRDRRERIETSLAASSQVGRGTMAAFYIVIILLIAAIMAAALTLGVPRHARLGRPAAEFYSESLWTRLAHSPMIATCAATR